MGLGMEGAGGHRMRKKHLFKLAELGCTYAVGVDEAGRGPLAGPVVAAAVYLPLDVEIAGLRDSKTMTAKARERCFAEIMAAGFVGIGSASAAEIDRINVLQASLLAMRRAVEELPLVPDICLIDGNQEIPQLPYSQLALVKGDARCALIAAASVIAKVTRDRSMLMWHEKYPAYGFDRHKGYPTKDHKAALRQWGPCPIHRRSFAGVIQRGPLQL